MSVVTQVLSGLMVLIGLWIVGRALFVDGGFTLGLIVGLLFVAAGAGRLYLERSR